MSDKVMGNPVTRARDSADQGRLHRLFPDLSGCCEPHLLALRPYLRHSPERFFSASTHTLMSRWLSDRDSAQRDQLREYVAAAEPELCRAFLFLRQINAEAWHDMPLPTGDDYAALRYVDKEVHPTYLRLVEGVLAPLIRPVAHFTLADRQRAIGSQDIFNLVEVVSSTRLAECTAPYNHVVRNGIGHGDVTYMHRQIRYRDKKGNEETLDVSAAVRLCDDLLDACNGMSAALKVFLLRSSRNGYRVPRELLVEALAQETDTPWWHIEACIESDAGLARQLLVYARPNSRDAPKIQWASFHSAVLAESLAPGYDRYFFSLRTPKALPGWAVFKGSSLRQLRETAATDIAAYASAIDEPGLFYVPRHRLPRLVGKIDTLVQSFRLHWPLAVQQIRENFGIPTIVVRNTEIHRNGWRAVVNAAVVIENSTGIPLPDAIRVHRRRITRCATRHARRSISLFFAVRYLLVGYVRVAVFSTDFRRRRLASFGLGQELICTVQQKSIRRIRSPDIIGSTVETFGQTWRVAWNRAWIESAARAGRGL